MKAQAALPHFVVQPSGLTLWLVRALVLAIFIAWSAAHLDGFSWGYDEGVHVYIAWLVQQGHPLYAQTFSPYTPGLIMTLVAAFQWFGASVFVARMVTVCCAALGMLGVMLIARELVTPVVRSLGALGWGLIAELAAALLLAVTPQFFIWSRAAMSDLPAAALMALAVASALIYLRTARLRWLLLAEFVAVGALWVKLIAIGGGLSLALILLPALRGQERKRLLIGTTLVVAVTLAPLLLFDVRALFEQAIYFHIQKRAAYADQSTLDKLLNLTDFLGANGWLTILAAFGALASLPQRTTRMRALVVVAWFGATFVSLVAQSPLFADHHAVVLVFSLAALAGAGIALAGEQLQAVLFSVRGRTSLTARQRIGTALAVACVLLALWSARGLDEGLRELLAPPFQPVAVEAVTMLEALTPGDDLLVSDAQMIAFRAQRQSPPALADTSQARLLSGNLTADALVALMQRSQPNGLLFWSDRLDSLAPFVEWAERNYHRVRSALQKPTSPYRLLLREAHPQIPLDARFDSGIRLLGYDVNMRSGDPIRSGQPLTLTLYFARTATPEPSYTVFVHLLSADGRVLAQDDHLPLAGRYPTDQWLTNEFVVDQFVLPLDLDLGEGDYSLELGLYQRSTMQRAPAFVGTVRQTDDRLLLKSVHVSAGNG